MSKTYSSDDFHHTIDRTHSPPATIELEPPSKKLRTTAPQKQTSLPNIPTDSAAVAITIPKQSITLVPSTMKSCPTLTSRALSSTYPIVASSLPDFKVGSLPHQLPSAWPADMINEFLTPPSNRSLSFSDPSSSSSLSSFGDSHPLVFDMDD
ncbi:hypothetical protein [Absidia glauca]|uniref:Uncharacterized protein n=1 Tax=Absidia glauca TaxID=4829 RepID=A0A168NTG6_ABSGL|nr:hypothetical protein [Absidia glauca]